MKLPSARMLPLLAMGWLCLVLFQPPSAVGEPYPRTAQTDQVDALFAKWDRTGSPGAAIGIFKDGRIVYARGYGMANLEHDIPNTPRTVFRIGSTSKHFTAMAVAVLIERGDLSLDDDIRDHLPELPAYQAPVTIRHLLHHTSGLRNYEHLTVLAGIDGEMHPSPYYTDAEAVAMIARQTALNFTPGEKYSYSNSNYFLLAEIIGRVSGMKTAEFARKYMFEPLGMSHTHFHDDVDVIVPNRASGYSPTDDGGFRINMTRLEQIGTGSIFTTIEDFFKWDQNFYDNKLGQGRQSLIDMVETPGTLNNGDSAHYGFGLNIDRFGGLRLISHGGAFVGFRSYYMRFPDQRLSIVLLANQGPFPLEEVVGRIAAIYLGDQMTEPVEPARPSDQDTAPQRQTIALSDDQRRAYAGRYYSAELDASYTLRETDGALTLRVGRYYTTDLVASEPDRFTWDYGTLEFTRNPTNDITGFLLHSAPIRAIAFEKVVLH